MVGPWQRLGQAWVESLLAGGYCGLVWWLSSAPRAMPAWLGVVPGVDKVVHLVEFLVLGVLVARALGKAWPETRGLRHFLITAVFVACYGVADEVHQAWVPGRSASVYDALADALGGCLGALAEGLWAARAARQPR
jgi:VanZ family protein